MRILRFDFRPRELATAGAAVLALLVIAYTLGRLDGGMAARRDALLLRPTIDAAVAVAELYDGDGVLMDVRPMPARGIADWLPDVNHPGSQPLNVCTSPAGQRYYSDRPCPKDWR